MGDNSPMMNSNENNNSLADHANKSSLILLSGDNARSTLLLHQALLSEGLHVDLAPTYPDIDGMWQQRRHQLVLLEVSGAHGVEAAVSAALQLKRRDPLQFVAYAADPLLHSSGLAGDAIFPRTSEHLAEALRRHFRGDK
jgi:hypothetical protein